MNRDLKKIVHHFTSYKFLLANKMISMQNNQLYQVVSKAIMHGVRRTLHTVLVVVYVCIILAYVLVFNFFFPMYCDR